MEMALKPDPVILQEMGRRLSQYRLNQNLTQAALATSAGVSLPTVQRIESGDSTQTATLLRILRALGLLANVDALVPDPLTSPLQQARMQGRTRKRASSSRGPEQSQPWTWGDDE